MRVPSNTLPTKGLYTKRDYIEIPVLRYKDIIEYDRNHPTNIIQKYIREIELILSKIEDWRSLLLFDLDSLLFTIKYISITSTPEINLLTRCPDCGEFQFTIKLSDLTFSEITDLAKIKSVTLGGNVFMINHGVTIGEFYDMLQNFSKWNLDIDKDQLLMMAYLIVGENINKVYDTIMNSVKSDIVVIYELKDKLISHASVITTCPNCKREVVVRLDNLITDIFRTLYINSDISEKINYFG